MSSFSKYVGNGAQTVFTVNQPMPSYSALEVSLDGLVETTGFTYNRTNATVTFAVAPADGVVVKLSRVTQVEPIHKFATGAAFTARNVDTNFTQESYRVEELQANVLGVKELEESVLQASEDAEAALAQLLASSTDYIQVGTFAAGYDSLQTVQQTLLYSDGHRYGWTGVFPKKVEAGDSPTPLGAGGWIDRSDVTLRNDLASSSGSELVFFKLSALSEAIAISKLLGQVVYAANFHGVDPTGVTDSTSGIQAAIDYAQTLVRTDTFTVGQSDKIGGATVILNGAYKVTDSLRVSKSNVRIEGLGGTSIHPYFTGTSGYKPVFIIGTAELWQTGNDITNATKYNAVNGLLIKRSNGSDGFIGILSSGTRNMEVSRVLVERGFCGLYMENTSELDSRLLSVTGCTYSIVGDNRGGRSAANSPLGVACTDNDVSSNNISMFTSYYSQHTGVLLINTGTTKVNGTVGIFSDNPSAPANIKLGLSTRYAGVHVLGVGQKWTRGGSCDGIVFEAKPTASRDCILLESGTNCPISGFVVDKCHVQTYAADHGAGNVTTLLRAITTGAGEINATMRDSGFTPSSAGYMYGNMHKVSGNSAVILDNCYPAVAYATASGTRKTKIRGAEVMETVNHSVFPPAGWLGENTGAGSGAVTGVGQQPFTRLTGNTTLNNVIYKGVSYREKILEMGAVYCTFLVKGNAASIVAYTVINGEADTNSSIVDGTNHARYSNQNYRQQTIEHNETEWTRVTMAFNPFDAGTAFDEVRFVIGRGAGLASEYIDIADIKIGYIDSFSGKYNPF